ncbi:hypothetical protein GT370_02950 [Acidocella sp. MX-AZ03]|nr:hypothetical protein [Acidocella sp. MX-AZ03]WBO59861.1 hypothetical protein GT370_02950 [Acidocella sp. MX-AZ03]
MFFSAACLILAGVFFATGAAIYELNLKYFDELICCEQKQKKINSRIRRRIMCVSMIGLVFGSFGAGLDFLGVFGNATWFPKIIGFINSEVVLIFGNVIAVLVLLSIADRILAACKDDFKNHLRTKAK